jgi:hypothetical protein
VIGQKLYACDRYPPFGVLYLMIASGCIGAAFAKKLPGVGIVAVLPALLGLALMLVRLRGFSVELRSDGLLRCFQRVWRTGKSKSATISVLHRSGKLIIPPCKGVPIDQLFDFLRQMIPADELPFVDDSLRAYLAAQAATFEADRVSTFNANSTPLQRSRKLSAMIAAALMTSIVWTIAAMVLHDLLWTGGAVLLFMNTMLIYWLRRMITVKHIGIKQWKKSSLVIAPVGLAMIQGDLEGELLWDELRDLKFNNSISPRHRRIELRIDGAKIFVPDIYDTPVAEIHRRIEHYWKAG